MTKSTARLTVATALILAVTIGWAPAAWAHATLVASSPKSGEHLAHAPRTVTLEFDQRVVPTGGGISVLDSSGKKVSAGRTSQSAPTTLTVPLRSGLRDGAYVADYTVSSVDGHIVSGGVVFLVGNASPGRIGSLTRQPDPLVTRTDEFGQFLTYLGVLVATGLAFFVVLVAFDSPERRRLARLTLWSAAVGVLGMGVTIVSQVVLAGGSRSSLTSWPTVRSVVSGGLGAQSAIQAVGLAGCLLALRARHRTTAQALALYSMIGAAGAFVLFGHARTASPAWATVPADAVHVVFAAVWVGGLVGLVTVLWSRTRVARRSGELRAAVTTTSTPVAARVDPPRQGAGSVVAVLQRPETLIGTAPDDEPIAGGGPEPGSEPVGRQLEAPVLASTVETVRRFSDMAAVSVAVLLVAGTVLALSLVGSVPALFETAYGQVLLLKLAVVGLLLVMAGYNRWFLLPWLLPGTGRAGDRSPAPTPPGSKRGWRVLMRTVRVEAIGVVAVLAITAVLANTTPASAGSTVPRPIPFSGTTAFAGGHLTLQITPNQALVNDLHVVITDGSGNPTDNVQSISAFFTLPAENVGPLETDVKKVGVGRYELLDTPLPPIVGVWQITLQLRVSDFDETDLNFTDHVR